MQILTLRVGQRIRIGAEVTVTIVKVSDRGATLKVVAPEGHKVVKVPAVIQHDRDRGAGGGALDSPKPVPN